LTAELNMTQMQFEKLKEQRRRRSHKCFYTSSPNHLGYIQSLATSCKDFH